MFWLIILITLGLLTAAGVTTWIVGAVRRDDDMRPVGVGMTIAFGLLTLLLWFFASFTRVPANSVGIVTEFGHQSGTVGEGAHFLAPWSSVDTFSTRVQSSVRTQASTEGDKASADCVQVRLKDGAGACVDARISYAVHEDRVVDLWRRYGSFEAMRDQLIRSATNDAFRVVFGGYTPEEAVAKGNGTFSDANRALSDSLNTPGVLTKMCLDAAREAKPTVFPNCFPGTGTGTPGVIVNPGK